MSRAFFFIFLGACFFAGSAFYMVGDLTSSEGESLQALILIWLSFFSLIVLVVWGVFRLFTNAVTSKNRVASDDEEGELDDTQTSSGVLSQIAREALSPKGFVVQHIKRRGDGWVTVSDTESEHYALRQAEKLKDDGSIMVKVVNKRDKSTVWSG